MEKRSQHLFYHPLCRQSCWCLCHRSARAQLEPQLEDRSRERESHGAKRGRGGGGGGANQEGLRKEKQVLHKARRKIKTWCDRYLNLKHVFNKLFFFRSKLDANFGTTGSRSELSAGWREADTTPFPVQCSLCAPHTVPFTSGA